MRVVPAALLDVHRHPPDASVNAAKNGSVSFVWYVPMRVRPIPPGDDAGPYGASSKSSLPGVSGDALRSHHEYASSSGAANTALAASGATVPSRVLAIPGARNARRALPSASPAALATRSSSLPDASTHGSRAVAPSVTITETPSCACDVSWSIM